MRIFSVIKDILSPKKCYSCKKEGHFLCNDCHKKVKSYKPSCFVCKQESERYKIHKKCKNNTQYYDKIIIKYHYDGKYISKMVKDGKFYGKIDVMKDFGLHLGELLLKNYKIDKDTVIVTVPLHFLRKLKRGYNQSILLGDMVSKVTKIPHNKNILYRKNNTRQQSKLGKKEREENIKNSFNIHTKYVDIIDKKNIILVDDVISTGSTLNEISKILKENGALKITCLCIASD